MIRYIPAAFLLCCAAPVTVRSQDAPATGDKKAQPGKGETKPPAKAAPKKDGPSLPVDVLNFHGKVTGTVESVDTAKHELRVKVASAAANPEKNKAPKPEALSGMTITVTPLEKRKASDSAAEPDEAAVAYFKGAKPGDVVTLDVRASSKGVVFRLLKVPVSGGK
jgi:hypothetical protein